MKTEFPKPVHKRSSPEGPSYQRHRRQLTSQIILPVVLAVILFIGMVVLINIATFRANGDVARWAAISTMWIAIPVFIMGFLFLALLIGFIYLLAQLLGITPTYTSMAQDFVRKIGMRVRQIADLSVKPVMFLNGIGATIQTLLGRK